MLDPKLAKNLMENQAVRQLVDHIKQEIYRLDRVTDIKNDSPDELLLEVRGRQRALEVLAEILKPLVNLQELSPGVSNKEFNVDVDDLPEHA